MRSRAAEVLALCEAGNPRDKVSEEVHSFIQTKLDRLLKRYPSKMKRWLKPVTYTHSATSSFSVIDKELRFSTLGLSGSVEEANDVIKKSNAKGFVVDSGQGALLDRVVHEFGHAVDDFIRDHADDNLRDAWFDEKKDLLDRLTPPSKYARSSNSEFFAEQFVVETLETGPEELYDLIDEFIEKLEEAGLI